MSEKNKTLTANNSGKQNRAQNNQGGRRRKDSESHHRGALYGRPHADRHLVCRPESYLNFGHYLYALGALTIFPLLSYPVSVIIPPIRKKGRDGQRNLAIVFSVIGYIAGILGSVFFGAGRMSFSFS